MRSPGEKEVLERIRPKEDEHNHTWVVATGILSAIEKDGRAKGMVVGSVARDTWLSGDRDLDIFLLFPPNLSREELEETGLDLARSIARRFTGIFHEKYRRAPVRERYRRRPGRGSRPLLRGRLGCRHPVSRGPHPFSHPVHLREIGPLRDDVLLAKAFAKACGVYGSDQMTEGFSGYLCELLVLHYGGFSPLIEAAAGWKPGTCIDLEGHACKAFEEPLRMIDPVDPARNVAAALSCTRMFEFVEYCRGYLENPSPDFFSPREQAGTDRKGFARALARRGTSLFAITFATPQLIPDIVVPHSGGALHPSGASSTGTASPSSRTTVPWARTGASSSSSSWSTACRPSPVTRPADMGPGERREVCREIPGEPPLRPVHQGWTVHG